MAFAFSPPLQSGQVLSLARVFDAPPELVFRLWSDPKLAQQWWRPDGYTTPFFEMDFRVGGAYRYAIRKDGQDGWAHGIYQEISAPSRLVFSFQWDSGDAAHDALTLVTVTFQAQAGKTLLTFRQEPFASVERRDGHAIGWGQVLDRLALHITSGETE